MLRIKQRTLNRLGVLGFIVKKLIQCDHQEGNELVVLKIEEWRMENGGGHTVRTEHPPTANTNSEAVKGHTE